MDALSFANPVFAAYAVAATLMILLASAASWLTVARMIQVKGGFRSPEDLLKTPLNPNPDPDQLAPNERVERVRLRRRSSLPAWHSMATSSLAAFCCLSDGADS